MSRPRAALDALLDGGLDRRKVSALRLRRMRTLNILCVWMVVTGTAVGAQFYMLGAWRLTAVVYASLTLVVAMAVLARRTKRVRVAAVVVSVAGLVVTGGLNQYTGGFHEPTFEPLFLTPVLAGLLIDGRVARRFCGLVALMALIFWWRESEGAVVPHLIPLADRFPHQLSVRVVFAVVMAVVLPAALSETERANALLRAARLKHERGAAECADAAARLAVATQDARAMLEHLPQGIFMVGAEGKLEGATSAGLTAIVGALPDEAPSLDGVLLEGSGLGIDRHEAILATIDSAIGADSMSFDLNEHHLPREVTFAHADGPRTLEVDWSAVEADDGTVTRIMVTVRDVTSLRQLQKSARAQQNQLAMLGELLHCAPGDYHALAELVRATADMALDAASGRADATQDALVHARRLKGDARSQGWTQLADAAHRLEERLVTVHDDPGADALRNDIERLRHAAARYEDVWRDTLRRAV